jgi:hypothetical protein
MQNGLVGLVAFLAGSLGAATNGFQCQTITLPAKDMPVCFADLNHNGRSDLLALDQTAKRLLIYRQRASGFPSVPDQAIDLPPRTSWIAPYHVEAGTGFELLMSTATGLVYFKQHAGVFSTEPRALIKADQIFTNDDLPILIPSVTNTAIPVMSATQAVLFQRNDAFEWIPGPRVDFVTGRKRWQGGRNLWTMGQNSSHTILVEESSHSLPVDPDSEQPKNDAIGKFMEEMKKASPSSQPRAQLLDLNGNGRKDLILWQVRGDKDRKTDIYVFLRGEDGRLPERPSQILHCRGFPIPMGSTWEDSPIGDLKGDGAYELVLLKSKFMIPTASSLVDMLLSHGVDMILTIRAFKHGAFSRTADASIPLTIMLSWYGTRQWPFFICGDFNGDGRPDLVVQRMCGQWDVFFSANDGRWFNEQPGMNFELPMRGYFGKQYFEINDLNGDGRADIVLQDPDDRRIFIFLTQPPPRKGNP